MVSCSAGILKDDQTLVEAKIAAGIKVMVIGSTVNDVIAVQPPDPSELSKSKSNDEGNVAPSFFLP